jgi:hypothetical protein
MSNYSQSVNHLRNSRIPLQSSHRGLWRSASDSSIGPPNLRQSMISSSAPARVLFPGEKPPLFFMFGPCFSLLKLQPTPGAPHQARSTLAPSLPVPPLSPLPSPPLSLFSIACCTIGHGVPLCACTGQGLSPRSPVSSPEEVVVTDGGSLAAENDANDKVELGRRVSRPNSRYPSSIWSK